MNKPRKIPSDRFWQEATDGETLNRWSATGAGSNMSGVVFVFKRVSNPSKNRQEASLWLTWPDDNHPCEKSQNETKNQYRNTQKTTPSMTHQRGITKGWYRFFPSGGSTSGRRGNTAKAFASPGFRGPPGHTQTVYNCWAMGRLHIETSKPQLSTIAGSGRPDYAPGKPG